MEREGTPLELDTSKALALLVYLAMTGQSHSRDALATLFWPKHDQSQGRTYLRRALLSDEPACSRFLTEVYRFLEVVPEVETPQQRPG